MKNITKFLAAFFIFAAAACFASCKEAKTTTLQIICKDGTTQTVKAELAVTPEEQQTGFMFRSNIPEGTGMLFIFEKSQVLSFWMKNTPSPLSIAYIDANGVIRNIFDMEPYSLETISSRSSVRYALEVPQGWFEKQNITVGDKLKLTDEILKAHDKRQK